MLRNYTSYGIRDVMNHDDLGNDFTDDILSEEL